MKVGTIVGVVGMVVCGVAFGRGETIHRVELDQEALSITGTGFFDPVISINGVEVVCDAQADFIDCDVAGSDIVAGATYQIRFSDGDYRPKLLEVYASDSLGAANGESRPQRLVAGNSAWYQAGDVAEFKFQCTEGLPVGLTAVQNDGSSWGAWRIADIDIQDCGQIANGCGVVKALKLKDGGQPIYIRGIMTCK